MTPDNLFLIFNNGVLLGWLLLVLAPGWEWTQRIVHSFGIPLLVAAAYGFSILAGSGEADENASFFSLAGVMLFFASPWSALAGWLHYLVFDLFVGAWEVRDARRRGIPHLAVVVCLVFTLMLGPIGLGLYALVRIFRGRVFGLEETAEVA
ncbi:MAG: ABA4-like family protein [Myxococcota bacterium]|nr:ABA4-like family protein [Myxococcota bacterium]